MKNQIAIYVGYEQGVSQAVIQEISLGIEEEGLPYEWCALEDQGARAIAQSMSRASKLDIGIGIGKDGWIAIHHKQFPEGFYLFETQLTYIGDWLRAIGANGARLVKGIPFKEISK